MSHRYHIVSRRLEYPMEQILRFCLRALGLFALLTCALFWLSLIF